MKLWLKFGDSKSVFNFNQQEIAKGDGGRNIPRKRIFLYNALLYDVQSFASAFYMSQLSEYTQQSQFCILLEQILSSSTASVTPTAQLAGFPCVIACADRVHADDDPSPLALAQAFPKERPKLLHFSGKARDIQDLDDFLRQAEQQQIQDILLLSGDKLKQHQFGETQPETRTRYLESVSALMYAKQHFPDLSFGVAFNPFKYTHSEEQAQYYKLQKKLKAGADFIITQLGYDLDKLFKFQQFLKDNSAKTAFFACVMPLTYRRAKFMVEQQVAGIEIAPHLLNLLQDEWQQDKEHAEQRVYQRAAVQIRVCQLLGFAGVHLSGCQQPSHQSKLEQALNRVLTWDMETCLAVWQELNALKTGKELQPILRIPMQEDVPSVMKYHTMSAMHTWLFSHPLAQRLGGFVFRQAVWQKNWAEKLILAVEHASKHALVGCESCGQCRLAETLYICPETCPKGLANGPCGGTRQDRCEFGDRECIHSRKLRLAEAVGEQHVLQDELIPAVPRQLRQHSSWINWFNPTVKT